MKSLAQQDLRELGGRGSVLSRQKRDHVRLDQLLHRLHSSEATEQGATLLKIYRLVFRHAYAEETILWPLIRRVLPDGHGLTLRVELEHQEINQLAQQLEALQPDSLEHRQVLDRLVELLREDVRDEEDLLLPRLQMKLRPADLRLVGFAWEAVRRLAPTRPHPIVSRRPPGNLLAALPLALLDHLRDVVDALLHGGAGSAAPSLRAFGGALAKASHAAERLPGLQQGEAPATRLSHRRVFNWTRAIATLAGASALLALASRRRG